MISGPFTVFTFANVKTVNGPLIKRGSGTLTVDVLPFSKYGVIVEGGAVKFADAATVRDVTTAASGDVTVPSNPSADLLANNFLAHRYTFNGNGNVKDEITKAEPEKAGLTWGEKSVRFPGGAANAAYVDFGANFLPTEGDVATIEFWITVHSQQKWSKLFFFGNGADSNLVFTVCNDNTLNPAATVNGNNTAFSNNFAWEIDKPYYVSCTINNGTTKWVIRDAESGEVIATANPGQTVKLSTLTQSQCCLSKSTWNNNTPDVTLEEFRVWNAVLSDDLLAQSCALGPDFPPATTVSASSTITLKLGGRVVTTGNVDLSAWTIAFADGDEVIADYLKHVRRWNIFETDGAITVRPTVQVNKAARANVEYIGTGKIDLHCRSGLVVKIK